MKTLTYEFRLWNNFMPVKELFFALGSEDNWLTLKKS